VTVRLGVGVTDSRGETVCVRVTTVVTLSEACADDVLLFVLDGEIVPEADDVFEFELDADVVEDDDGHAVLDGEIETEGVTDTDPVDEEERHGVLLADGVLEMVDDAVRVLDDVPDALNVLRLPGERDGEVVPERVNVSALVEVIVVERDMDGLDENVIGVAEPLRVTAALLDTLADTVAERDDDAETLGVRETDGDALDERDTTERVAVGRTVPLPEDDVVADGVPPRMTSVVLLVELKTPFREGDADCEVDAETESDGEFVGVDVPERLTRPTLADGDELRELVLEFDAEPE
jgi:hypothetical protein